MPAWLDTRGNNGKGAYNRDRNKITALFSRCSAGTEYYKSRPVTVYLPVHPVQTDDGSGKAAWQAAFYPREKKNNFDRRRDFSP